MSAKRIVKPRLRGAYIIKAAESPSQRPPSATKPPVGRPAARPAGRDRRLARAVLRAKTAERDARDAR